ncbi:MAG TPA: hypothetical protein VGM78_07300, partial [Ilumatobacteraceae bacterium]
MSRSIIRRCAVVVALVVPSLAAGVTLLGADLHVVFAGSGFADGSQPTLAAGEFHHCALLSAGTVTCWGDNGAGQLGDGSTVSTGTPVGVNVITGATPDATATSIAAGSMHTCALMADKTVTCWGDNASGQLGVDPSLTPLSSTPIAVPGVSDVVAIAAGDSHTCAVLTGGSVQCWGANDEGQLGRNTGPSDPSYTAKAVPGLTTVIGASTGTKFTCALLANGGVSCWGLNDHLQLGRATAGGATPVVVAGLDGTAAKAKALDIDGDHACAVLADATISCWGAGFSSTDADNATPTTLSGFANVTVISVGTAD